MTIKSLIVGKNNARFTFIATLLIGVILLLPLISAYPAPTVHTPNSTFDFGKVGTQLTLNWSVAGNNLATCWFEYNGANTTLSTPASLAYNTGDDTDKKAYVNSWAAQSFMATEAASIEKIQLLIRKDGTVNWDYQVRIFNSNADGTPTGSALASGMIETDTVSTSNAWYNVTMSAYALTQWNNYTIVVNGTAGGDESNTLIWRYKNIGTYAFGNATYTDNAGSAWTLTGRDQLFQIFYGNDGSTCSNGTYNFSQSDYSKKSLRFYVNDTSGNLNSSTVNWGYRVFENSVTYTTPAIATSSQTFKINLSFGLSYSSIIGKLIYNSTEYTSTSTDGGNVILTNNINLPTTSTQQNKTFYWSVTLDGNTNINTTSYNQTVNALSFNLCGGAYTIPFINFSSKSAENPFPRINATFKSAWHISSSQTGSQSLFTYEDISGTNNSWAFCSAFNDTLYVDADIEYDSNGYALNFYYLNDATLTNLTQNISLYLLNDSEATITTLKAVDNAQNPVTDVTIQIQLYDVGTGTFYLVSMAKTDFKGEDISYLNWYDSLYKFVLIQDGTVIKTTNTTRISSTPVTFDISDSTDFEYEKFQDFVYSLYFNNVTNNFVLTFTKPSGLVDEGCLRVLKRNGKNDTQICLTCESSSSATLYCNINSYGNGTYIAHFYATGSWYDLDWIYVVIGAGFADEIYDLLGSSDASFYAFIFAGIVVFMFFIHPIFGVLGAILGVLGAGALGFAPLNYGIFVGIALIGGVIIWMLKR